MYIRFLFYYLFYDNYTKNYIELILEV